MRLHTSTRRRGVTLTEVLIAIFVLALGLLGVLSLFPLGVVRMAQAIKDDRSALANHNATTQIRLYWKDQLALVPPLQQNPSMSPVQIRDYFFSAMLDPNAPFLPPNGTIPAAFQSTTTPAIPFYAGMPSYPIYIDGIGFNNPNNQLTAQQFWIGGQPGSIPRRSLRDVDFTWNGSAYVTNPFQRVSMNHYFIQMDDVGFGNNGLPTDAAGNAVSPAVTPTPLQVQVDGRYNWAYLLRRQKAILWDQADLTVVVYGGRSIDGPTSGTETLCNANFVPGSTELTLIYSGTRPHVRKGTWLLDATMSSPVASALGATTPEPHGYFYRVNAVTAETTGATGTITVELQQTIQQAVDLNGNVADSLLPHGTGNPLTPYGVVAIMDNVVEVFDRKTLTSVITPVP